MNIACISILSDRGFCFLKILIQHSIGIHIYIIQKNTINQDFFIIFSPFLYFLLIFSNMVMMVIEEKNMVPLMMSSFTLQISIITTLYYWPVFYEKEGTKYKFLLKMIFSLT